MPEKTLPAKKKRPKRKKPEYRPFWEGIFSLQEWVRGYRRWVVAFFAAIVVYRDTTDGLIFLFFMAYGIAKNLEGYIHDGVPFIFGKRRNQTIKEYGYIRTIVSVISPFDLWRRKRNPVERQLYVFIGGLVFMVFLNHCYLLCVFLFDYFFPQTSASFFTAIEGWCWPLLSHVHGFMHNRLAYIDHGYADQVYLLSQMYLCALVGAVIFIFYLLYVFCTRKDMVKSIHLYFQKNIKELWESRRRRKIFRRFLMALFYGKYSNPFIYSIVFICFVLLLYVLRLPLYFLGEPEPRGGKYALLYCYAYRSYFGYFTYSYMLYFFYLGTLATGGICMSCWVSSYMRIRNFFMRN